MKKINIWSLILVIFFTSNSCKENVAENNHFIGKSILSRFLERDYLIREFIEKRKCLGIDFRKKYNGNDSLIFLSFSFHMKTKEINDSIFGFTIEPYTKNVIDFKRLDKNKFILKVDPKDKDTVVSYFLDLVSENFVFYVLKNNKWDEYGHKVFLFNVSHN